MENAGIFKAEYFYGEGNTRRRMTTLEHKYLVSSLENAAIAAGWQLTGQEQVEKHVSRLIFWRGKKCEDVLAHLWNLKRCDYDTPQFYAETSNAPIHRAKGVKTLLLGYWQQNDVFASWDAGQHLGNVSSSPSHQIREEYLMRAVTDGLAVCPRGKDEVAVAFVPTLFINYVRNIYDLYKAVTSAEQIAVTHIAQNKGQITEVEIASLPVERQIIIRTIAEKQRASDFRRRVLAAYENRCALCGMQLRLVDAAHIIPVKHSSSNDETKNGLCLCALHHRAFDQGLVAILPNYQVVVNRTKLMGLQMLGLHDGEEMFIKNLRTHLRVPAETSLAPNASIIKTALRVRELQQDALEPVPTS